MFEKAKKYLKIFSAAMTLTLAVTTIGAAVALAEDGVVASAQTVPSVGASAFYTPERLDQMLMTADNSGMARGALIDALNLTYPDGSFYSNNIDGCKCHLATNNCTPAKSCDCKNFASSIQCMAFAKYCHRVYNGTDEASLTDIKGDQTLKTLTTTNLYDVLSKVGSQVYLRGKTKNKSWHSVFVVSFTKTKVEVYDANSSGTDCKVRHKTLSYNDFLDKFSYIDYAITADNKMIEY